MNQLVNYTCMYIQLLAFKSIAYVMRSLRVACRYAATVKVLNANAACAPHTVEMGL